MAKLTVTHRRRMRPGACGRRMRPVAAAGGCGRCLRGAVCEQPTAPPPPSPDPCLVSSLRFARWLRQMASSIGVIAGGRPGGLQRVQLTRNRATRAMLRSLPVPHPRHRSPSKPIEAHRSQSKPVEASRSLRGAAVCVGAKWDGGGGAARRTSVVGMAHHDGAARRWPKMASGPPMAKDGKSDGRMWQVVAH